MCACVTHPTNSQSYKGTDRRSESQSLEYREIKTLLRKNDDIESKVSMCVLVFIIPPIARSYGDCKK